MARRIRNRIGRFMAGPMGAAGILLLSLALASGRSLAGSQATLDDVGAAATHAPAPSLKAAPAKPDSANSHVTVAKTSTTAAKPGATTAKTPPASKTAVTAAPKAKLAPPSRLATMATPARTRATAMPHPENVRAALVRKRAPAKTSNPNMAHAPAAPSSAPNPALARGPATQGSSARTTTSIVPAGPRGAVTLSPAKPGAPVPMGIPAGNAKLTAGTGSRTSDARVVSASATRLTVVPGAKGVAAGKTTSPAPANPAGKLAATVAQGDHQGSVTRLPKTAAIHTPTVSPMGKTAMVPTPPALEDQVAYQYNALGRRDPFNSLLEGEFVGNDEGGDAPPDLGGLKVVGIMWGSQDQFAMVEDVKGNSFVLRRGDKIMNGFVEGLKRDAMIVNITVDGQSESVTVPITRKGEKSNANR
jgi:hypothetical protein